MEQLSIIHKVILFAIPILFAITVHEASHGWVASKLGDQTARILGRITLNPIRHIDPIGTLLVPALLIIAGAPFLFGWAKPVPVNVNQLNKPKRDMAIVAAAGPISNFIMAIIWAMIMKFSMSIPSQGITDIGNNLYIMAQIGVLINIVLMVLNFLPIPPLDGSKVLSSFLPPRAAINYQRLEPYGFFILLGLLLTGILWTVMGPMIVFFKQFIYLLFQLS